MPGGEVGALFNIPKPRQEWIDGKFVQRHEKNEEAWVELFNDLIYVVLLTKLGDLFISCEHNVFNYFKLCTLFWTMCLTRQAIDEYSNRFYSHDLVHKLIYVVYSAGVFIQVLNINRPNELASNQDVPQPHDSIRLLAGSSSTKASGTVQCLYFPLFGLGLAVGIIITRLCVIFCK
jgi:hypothetical protein